MTLLLPLAQEIARCLGREWSVETQDNHWVWLVCGNWHFHLSQARDPHRVEIRGGYDQRRDFGFREYPPVITVATERGGQAIAREMQRRLLPAYQEYCLRVEAAYADYSRKRNAELDAMNLLAEVTNGRLPERSPGNLEVRFGNYGSYLGPYGKASHFYQGRLELELGDLTPQEAEQVLELLIKLRGQKRDAAPDDARGRTFNRNS